MSPAIAQPQIQLRRARPDDCVRVWEWNFAPDVRAVSRDARTVTFTEHARWYERRLARTAEPMWVVLDARVPVGIVRLDRIGGAGDVARISIALAARARGKGVGRRALAAACLAWNRPIVAEILATNTASRACFEACEFEAAYERGGVVTYHWSP
ncbi:MAG: GNAT family N-acetyltransferase [Deltaproteobacteria bacterium]|nr:GNAT family N-acetyltransferase [Deltaproteobacteria bacterium]MCW5803161.1 GNAT family N-acetyltransferase [Deltaproteobacteria bacterium]